MSKDLENLDKNKVYKLLEDKFVTYQNLKAIKVQECGEKMVELGQFGIDTYIYKTDVQATSNSKIWVRGTVAEMLQHVQNYLSDLYPQCRLQVFYGYRSPSIQKESFEKIVRQFEYQQPLSDKELENVHRFIAVPDVAGHPTGGAVDVTIVNREGVPFDMGTAPHAFEKDSYTFSPFISKMAWDNRQILRNVMLSAGFCPFDGEWWHFSYGDKEWAFYSRKAYAIFDSVTLPE